MKNGWFSKSPIRKAFYQLVAMDIGTSKISLLDIERDEFLEEPAVIVVDNAAEHHRVVAVGHQARSMVDRTTGTLLAVHPVQDGVVVDLDRAELLLRHLLQRVSHRSMFPSYEVVVALPPCSTEVERRALRDTVLGAGARYVHLVDKAVAAALGSGIAVNSPVGSMVVDVGAGSTLAAIVNGGSTACSAVTRAGGNRMDQAIIADVRRNYGVLIGERTAEQAKIAIGAAMMSDGEDDPSTWVRGRSTANGMPVEIMISRSDIVRALAQPLSEICKTTLAALRDAKPELVSDVMEAGIVLTGGAGALRHLDRYLADIVDLPVFLGATPRRAVALGAARLWENTNTSKDLVPF